MMIIKIKETKNKKHSKLRRLINFTQCFQIHTNAKTPRSTWTSNTGGYITPRLNKSPVGSLSRTP